MSLNLNTLKQEVESSYSELDNVSEVDLSTGFPLTAENVEDINISDITVDSTCPVLDIPKEPELDVDDKKLIDEILELIDGFNWDVKDSKSLENEDTTETNFSGKGVADYFIRACKDYLKQGQDIQNLSQKEIFQAFIQYIPTILQVASAHSLQRYQIEEQSRIQAIQAQIQALQMKVELLTTPYKIEALKYQNLTAKYQAQLLKAQVETQVMQTQLLCSQKAQVDSQTKQIEYQTKLVETQIKQGDIQLDVLREQLLQNKATTLITEEQVKSTRVQTKQAFEQLKQLKHQNALAKEQLRSAKVQTKTAYENLIAAMYQTKDVVDGEPVKGLMKIMSQLQQSQTLQSETSRYLDVFRTVLGSWETKRNSDPAIMPPLVTSSYTVDHLAKIITEHLLGIEFNDIIPKDGYKEFITDKEFNDSKGHVDTGYAMAKEKIRQQNVLPDDLLTKK